MSGSVKDYDGLCGVMHLAASSEQQVRCNYEFGHEGDHSWIKLRTTYPIHYFIHDTTLEKRK